MRHLASLGLLLEALLGLGCWDFDALHTLAPPPDQAVPDLSRSDAPVTCQKDSVIENCSNGIDDNNDCLIDCADPECTNSEVCQPITPLGYGELLSTAMGAAAPSCAMNTSQQGPLVYEGLNVPSTCSGCKCGQSCTSELRSYTQADCMGGKVGAQVAKVELTTGQCAQITAGTNEYLDPSEPGCTTDNSATKPDPITYTRRDVLCLAGGLKADCTTPSCIAALLGSSGCVALAGDVACPSPFLAKTSGNTGGADTRGCTCSCGASGTPTCTGTPQLYPMAMCMGTGTALPAMTCTPLGTGTYVGYPVMPSGLTCTANQTQNGSFPQAAVTLCCL